MQFKRMAPTVEEVLRIARTGSYDLPGGTIQLPFPPEALRQVRFYSGEALARLPAAPAQGEPLPMTVSLWSLGSLEAARALHEKYPGAEKAVLVLNFANPTRPCGGSFRDNPGTQEEHLCHYTTLLSSIASEEAEIFFDTNKAAKNPAQTDCLLISPHVMVLRSRLDALTENPFPISVLTVSAPIAKRMAPADREGLPEILLRRIRGMLHAAEAEGFRYLVLGAWGCGSFGNDPELVAALFHQALTEMDGAFEAVVFAIPGGNHSVFARHFQENPK